MNRILFEPGEIADATVVLDDVRAAHILDVLHGEVGQPLKTGVLDGPIGRGEIVAIDGRRVTVRVTHDKPSLAPWADVILAPPRPRVFKRLLPQLAALGVGRIVLVGAKKVEKDFWGATLLRQENYRPLLVDGLMQSGTSIVPQLFLRRDFRRFLEADLESFFPIGERLVAHPYPDGTGRSPRRDAANPRKVLAIGPEGGWTDDEVGRLEARGFVRYSLGRRILRTDTATVALLARLNPEIDHMACDAGNLV